MFDDYFEVFLADTPESRKLHYMIRYQVYCEEMGFLPNKDYFLRNEEWDHWDKHSAHFLVRHKYTGQWVGAMRLVAPENDSLPLCEHAELLDEQNNPIAINQHSIELSRLCLVKEIRRACVKCGPPFKSEANQAQEKQQTIEQEQSDKVYSQKRVNLSIIWGLFRATADYCIDNDINDWYFLTNKALARLVKREGFVLHQIGAACERGGERYPYKMDLADIIARKSSSQMVLEDHSNSFRLFSEYENEFSQDYEFLSA